MKGLFITKRNELGILELPKPSIGPYDALTKMAACSICNSTDTKLIHAEFFGGTYPVLLGHESVGIITEVGEKVKNYKIGDMVLRPGMKDEQIPFDGGRSCWGGFAEYGVVTDFWAKKGVKYGDLPHPQQIVPAGIQPTEATSLITLKENLSCLENAGVVKGQSLAIVGTGPVAQAQAFCAKQIGINPVVVFGRREEKRSIFLNLGADEYIAGDNHSEQVQSILNKGGFDRVIEAVGSCNALDKCLEICDEKGKIYIYGLAPESEPFTEQQKVDSRVFISEPNEPSTHEQILKWVEEGKITFSDWITCILPWTEFQKGFDLIWNKKTEKVVLTF